MNVFSLLSFFAFIVYVYLGVRVWRLDRHSPVNRSFVALCAAFAIWSSIFVFLYPARDKETAWVLYKFAAVGWTTFPAIALYFVLAASRSPLIRGAWRTIPFLIPGPVFLWRVTHGPLVMKDFSPGPLGWCEIAAADSLWYAAYVIYAAGSCLLGVALLVRWWRAADDAQEKRQARTILTGWAIGGILMFVPNILLPALGLHLVPAIGPIVSLVFPFAIWFGMTRHRLMTFTASIAADAIVSRMADMTLLVDPSGRVVLASPSACRTLDRSARDLEGMNVTQLFEPREVATDVFRRVLEAPDVSVRGEIGWRKASGTSIPADTHAAAVLDSNRQLLGLVVVGQDLRPRKQLEAELEERQRIAKALSKARDQAETANRAKSTFLANMSHELRTPLNAVIGYSEMLREEAQERRLDTFLPDLDKIGVAARHLLGIISDILELSKIDAGRMEVTTTAFDLNTIAAEAVSNVRPVADSHGNSILMEIGDIGIVYSDPTKVRQILVSLLTNAARFTESGSIRVQAEREQVDGTDWVRIEVSDTGCGMEQDEVALLFRPFTQVDASPTRRHGGVGLGLAITKRLCELLGGEISVTSTPGKGSTFVVRLPSDSTADRNSSDSVSSLRDGESLQA